MAFAWIDWAVILAYLGIVMAIGVWAMLRVRDAGGFLLGRRKLGKAMMIASTFAGGINANHPISIASNTYRNGLSGMWLSLTYILMTPFFWMWPPLVRRLRIVTTIDLFRLRYGRAMEMAVNASSMISHAVAFGAGTKAAYEFIKIVSGNQVTDFQAQAMIVIPTVIYTLMGGVVAAYATDLFQSLFIIVLSFLLIPFAIWALPGGAGDLAARVPAESWVLVSGNGTPGVWLFWFAVSLLASAPMVYGGGAGSARNEMAARWAILGNLGKRFCTIGWGLVGVIAIALYGAAATSGIQPDTMFARACVDTLPAGLRGVMVASILAAVMSTLAGIMLSMGGQIVNNVYKDYLVREATPRHYLLMARVFTALSVVLGWAVAAAADSLVHIVIVSEQINGVVGITVLACIFWRRVTAAGAVAAIAVMAPLFYCGNLRVENLPDWYRSLVALVQHAHLAVGLDPHFNLATAAGTVPVQMSTPIYVVAGSVVLVLVSLATRQHNDHTVREFYARLDTPVGEEHRLKEGGFEADTLEELVRDDVAVAATDHDVSRRLLLLDFFTWPWLVLKGRARLSDYRVDLLGVAGSLLFIAGFLYLVKGIAAVIR